MTNKEICLDLSIAIMKGDWSHADALLSKDFQYTADGRPTIGKADYLGFMKNVLCTAMTNMEMDFLHVICEGEFVSVNYTNKMDHTGNFMGIPATNKRVLASGQFIREIRDGLVIAEWQTTNAMGLMKELGVFK